MPKIKIESYVSWFSVQHIYITVKHLILDWMISNCVKTSPDSNVKVCFLQSRISIQVSRVCFRTTTRCVWVWTFRGCYASTTCCTSLPGQHTLRHPDGSCSIHLMSDRSLLDLEVLGLDFQSKSKAFICPIMFHNHAERNQLLQI